MAMIDCPPGGGEAAAVLSMPATPATRPGDADPTRLSLAVVRARCAEESDRFARGRAHDDRYGHELFRRAIVDGDGDAWESLIVQYRNLVRGWLCHHPLADAVTDAEDMTMRVFERFWQALRPGKFGAFPHLAGLLRYLKLCAFATLIDEARVERRWRARRAPVELADEIEGERADTIAMATVDSAILWRVIEAALPDPAERLVIYSVYVLGLAPRAIASRHREIYPSVEDVYRRKRLALERLRRAPGVRGSWREVGPAPSTG